MNRIVRERYPMSKLPQEWQSELRGVREVRVVIEDVEPSVIETGEENFPVEAHPFSRFRHLARDNFSSVEEVVEHVRALRDEWDQREQFHEHLRHGS